MLLTESAHLSNVILSHVTPVPKGICISRSLLDGEVINMKAAKKKIIDYKKALELFLCLIIKIV
jgi:hypothetical protein